MQRASLYKLLLHRLLWPLILILVAGSTLAYFFALKAAMNASDLGLMDNAMDLSKQVESGQTGLEINLPPAARKMLQESNDDKVTYAAWDSSGRLFSGSDELKQIVALPREGNRIFQDVVLDGERNRALVMRGKYEDNAFFIAVAQTLHGRDRLADGLFAGILLPEALLAIVSLAVILFGVRGALAPVNELRKEITLRSSTDLRPLDEHSAPADLAPIIHGINELLENLSASFASHRRFIADAAHQLRTPLASLSSQIEVALQHPPQGGEELLRALLSTAQRTTHLANQLLSLARLEHTELSMLEVAQVEMDKLIRETSGDFVILAGRKGIELSFGVEPCQVRGSPLMLRELLANLLDNAVRYTPAGGEISVGLSCGSGKVELVVEDNGPGVPENELEKLGTPFHRLAPSSTEGCGLGLAIVREIARLHGAKLSFTQGKSGIGMRVSVHFLS